MSANDPLADIVAHRQQQVPKVLPKGGLPSLRQSRGDHRHLRFWSNAMREHPVHRGPLVAVLLCTALASISAAVLPVCAEPAPVGQAVNSPLPLPPAHPLVAAIRSKLADPLLRKGTNAEDFAALEAFYALRAGRPVWMTEMGFSAKGQQALFEVEKADDWGLDHLAFELPPCRRTAGESGGAGRCRDQARSRHSEICPLCARRTVEPA